MGGNARKLFYAGLRIIKEPGRYQPAKWGIRRKDIREGDLAGAITVTYREISGNKRINYRKSSTVTGQSSIGRKQPMPSSAHPWIAIPPP